MSADSTSGLRRTVLWDWHRSHGGRMVGFGGWEMPVQYASGIVGEHVATRTAAGLFDVSHMGRLRFAGAGAEAFLGRALTNDAAALKPGEAQYTLFSDAAGGAIDDAYLYRLAADEFLLVVNAANRDKDVAWLRGLGIPDDVSMEDLGERLAMIALQGPTSAQVLGAVLPATAFPEDRRNRSARSRVDGVDWIVARTGYTGEALGFELFVDSRAAESIWQRLVDAGAVPAGLGARDSLRLEAGLPLYGHEFGADRDGQPIPIFANALARFGVRPADRGGFIGAVALARQRAEFEAIAGGRLATPLDERVLRRLVRPIAVFEGRRPLRAGYDLRRDGEPVGYVTSGTSVPCPRAGQPLSAGYDMRPIGLALLRSDLPLGAASGLRLEVVAAADVLMYCRVVPRNLPPAVPPL